MHPCFIKFIQFQLRVCKLKLPNLQLVFDQTVAEMLVNCSTRSVQAFNHLHSKRATKHSCKLGLRRNTWTGDLWFARQVGSGFEEVSDEVIVRGSCKPFIAGLWVHYIFSWNWQCTGHLDAVSFIFFFSSVYRNLYYTLRYFFCRN